MENVIFDIDGTLYSKEKDNGYLHSGSNAEDEALAKKLELPLNTTVARLSALRKSYGYRTKSEAVIKGFGCSFEWWNLIREGCYHPEKYLTPNVPLATCIQELALSNRGIVVLATNSPREIGKRVANVLGLGNLIESNLIRIFGPEDLDAFKPQQEYFLRLADLLECPTESFLSIGDRLDADIHPTRAIGMEALLVDGPDQVVSFLRELI